MQTTECKKSPDRKHQWNYPRLEDSIDRDRSAEISNTYCKFCFIKKETLLTSISSLKRNK